MAADPARDRKVRQIGKPVATKADSGVALAEAIGTRCARFCMAIGLALAIGALQPRSASADTTSATVAEAAPGPQAVHVSGNHGEDVYSAGPAVDVDGDSEIHGDFVAMGRQISIHGRVDGDVLAIAEDIFIDGIVDGTVHAVARRIRVSGQIGRDLRLAARDVAIEDAATIGNRALIWGTRADVGGAYRVFLGVEAEILNVHAHVEGDAHLFGTDLQIGSQTDIRHQTTISTFGAPRIEPGAMLRGEVFSSQSDPANPANRLKNALGIWSGLVLIGLIVAKVSTPRLIAGVSFFEKNNARSLANGVVLVVAGFAAQLTILVSGLLFGWWWIALLLFPVFASLLALGVPVVAIVLGRRVFDHEGGWAMHATQLTIGIVLLSAADSIVGYHFLLAMAAIMGIGAVAGEQLLTRVPQLVAERLGQWAPLIARSALFVGVAILLTIAGLELVLRFVPVDRVLMSKALYYQANNLPVYEQSPDRFLHYQLRPSSFYERHDAGRSYSVHIDPYGARGAAHPEPKGARTFRILAFGGSTMFGFNVNDDQTIPAVLERRLNAAADGTSYEVFNFGTEAYTLSQVAHLALSKMDKHMPDLVLVQLLNQGRRPFLFDADKGPAIDFTPYLDDSETLLENFPSPLLGLERPHVIFMRTSASYRAFAALARLSHARRSYMDSDSRLGDDVSFREAGRLVAAGRARHVPVIFVVHPAAGTTDRFAIAPGVTAREVIWLFQSSRSADFYDPHPPPEILAEWANTLAEELASRRYIPPSASGDAATVVPVGH